MLIFKTSNNKFFEKLLNYNTKIISKKFKGGDKKALNLEDFKNIIFPIPSLEKQKEIVNKIEKFENYKLQYIDHANMIKEELDNYIKYINDNEIDENINYNNIINDNESEVDLEIEIEDSISESSE
jgi:restriction endonuclease S subunit